jgi:hypothetical protein
MITKFLKTLLLLPLFSYSQTEIEGNFIKINVSGGTPPYTYSMDSVNFQTNDTFKCLSPGLYKYHIKDYYNNTISKSITLYAVLSGTVTSVGRTSVTILGVNGKPSYTYKLSTSSTYKTGGTFSNLQRRRTYTFNIKDSLGYIVTITATTL